VTVETRSPTQALDFPHLNDDLFILWYTNGFRWPDPRRRVAYLSAVARHVLKDYTLFTDDAAQAATFPTLDAALQWQWEQEKLRGMPYYGVKVTTVREMKQRCGYAA